MPGDESSSTQDKGRVVKFRRGIGAARPISAPPRVADLSKFERGAGTDDYRHRMLVNVAALMFVVALIAAGLWLADSMARMLRNQNCVLAGHRNCAQIDVTGERR
jgi:hypothetical protein